MVVFKGKKKYGVTIKARKAGTVKMTGVYKGKKYRCKIKVIGNDELSEKQEEETDCSQSGKAKLNAGEAKLYYLADEDKQFITQPYGHTGRRYMILQPSDENLQNIAKESRIDLSYFD